MNKKRIILALTVMVLSMSNTAMAVGSDSATMTVSANIVTGCTVSDATMDFGDINFLLGEAIVASTAGSLKIACNGVSPTIKTSSPRVLRNTNNDEIPFKLGTSPTAALTDTLPADPTAGVAIAPAVLPLDGVAVAFDLFGLIPAAAYAGKPAGIYTASITVVVAY
jgi:spore coat protein U-like protein